MDLLIVDDESSLRDFLSIVFEGEGWMVEVAPSLGEARAAIQKNEPDLVDAVYSGVPARLVGREQTIEIGPMSGRSNVVYWLERRGLAATDECVDRIFAKAKAASGVLSEEDVRACL